MARATILLICPPGEGRRLWQLPGKPSKFGEYMDDRTSFPSPDKEPPAIGRQLQLDPSLTLYLDESGNGNPGQPLIVGAVACDAYAVDPEEEIRAFYEELKWRRNLVGLPSFESFINDGFHASENPREIAAAFREMAQQKLHFKLYMFTTDRTSMAPLTETEQLKELYIKILTDITRSAHHRVSVNCIFEQNEQLKDIILTLPAEILQRLSGNSSTQRRVPPITVDMKPKLEAMSIAIIDFAMLTTSRWIRSGYSTDPEEWKYRAFREVEPMLSVLYSLEKGLISSRSLPLH